VFLPQSAHGDAAFLTDIAFSSDGTKVVATSVAPSDFIAGFIHIFNAPDGAKLRLIFNDYPYDNATWAATFSPDGMVVLVGAGLYGDNTFKKWQVSDGAPLPRPTGHQFPVTSLALSPDGRQVVTAATSINGGTAELKCWDAADGRLLWSSNNFYSLASAFSPNGSLLAIGRYSQIDLLNPTNGTFLRTLTSSARDVGTIAFSPDGAVLASGGGFFSPELSLWQVTDGSLLRNFVGHTSNVTAVAFSPDGATLASASVDKTVRLWRVSDGAALRTLTNHTARVNAVAFSHNGLLLVSGGSDQTVRVWRVSDGTMLKSLPHDEGEVKAVAFSSDDELLLTGCGETDEFSLATGKPIKVWRVSDGALLGVYDRETVSVNAISFSSDGRRFAYGRGDATVVMAYTPLWITESSRTNGELIFQWQGGSGRYQLQQRTNLTTGAWQDVGAPTTATGVTNNVSGASLFYRVQSLPN
jgi:WD40 repeat protein